MLRNVENSKWAEKYCFNVFVESFNVKKLVEFVYVLRSAMFCVNVIKHWMAWPTQRIKMRWFFVKLLTHSIENVPGLDPGRQ